jgi:hypothetical protein
VLTSVPSMPRQPAHTLSTASPTQPRMQWTG